jgi:glutaredoxin
VKLYTRETCPSCASAKRRLAALGVEYVERDLDRDPVALAEWALRYSQIMSVPFLVLDDGRALVADALEAWIQEREREREREQR